VCIHDVSLFADVFENEPIEDDDDDDDEDNLEPNAGMGALQILYYVYYKISHLICYKNLYYLSEFVSNITRLIWDFKVCHKVVAT
jgi:hypothetical protein